MRPKFEDGSHVLNCQGHVPGGRAHKMPAQKRKCSCRESNPGLQGLTGLTVKDVTTTPPESHL